MMKKIAYIYAIIILGLLLFVPGFLSADTYYDYEKVEIEELPIASEDTLNKVYIKGKSYYITESNYTPGEQRTIQLNDNICTSKVKFKGLTKEQFDSLSPSSFTSIIKPDCYVYGNGGKIQIGLFNNQVFADFKTTFPLEEKYLNFTYTDSSCVISYINEDYRSLIDMLLVIETDGVYSYFWKEVNRNDVYEIQVSEDDFYLFYNFEDIKKFNILGNYDLESFTDFQKVVIVLGFNILFLGIIGLTIYIFIKLVYKGISMIFKF